VKEKHRVKKREIRANILLHIFFFLLLFSKLCKSKGGISLLLLRVTIIITLLGFVPIFPSPPFQKLTIPGMGVAIEGH
jgi:hypothetical protein